MKKYMTAAKTYTGILILGLILLINGNTSAQQSKVTLDKFSVRNYIEGGPQSNKLVISFKASGADSLYALKLDMGKTGSWVQGEYMTMSFVLAYHDKKHYLLSNGQKLAQVFDKQEVSFIVDLPGPNVSTFSFFRLSGTDYFGKSTNEVIYNKK
jgi:hypothetical protein